MADGGNPIFSPPRSITTFGVSGLLGDNCRVFYDSIFTTRHLGRVADLLSARLQKAEPDELRLRALLLFLAYEGFRAQFPVNIEVDDEEEDPGLALKAPLTIECGIDSEKIAVGVSFAPHESQQIDISGLEERIRSGTPANRIEKALCELLSHSGSVFLRRQPSTGRIELAAWVGIRDKAVMTEARGVLAVHEIPEDPEATPRAQQYAELGDEDYDHLLKDESKGRGDSDEDDDAEKTIEGDEEDEDGNSKVGGKDPEDKDSKRRLGAGKRRVDGSRTVSGGEEEEDGDDEGRGSSAGEEDEDDTQRLGGRDPKRKGRMKASGEAEDEALEESEEDLKLGGKDHSRKTGRKLGVKSDDAGDDQADADDEELRLGSAGKGKTSRKIGVKGGEQSSSSGDGEEGDDDMRLGSAEGGRRSKRSREEREADERGIREFDDSQVDPSNISADQVQRYKDQIQRMSRKISDLEEDRSKWMRMVKSEAAAGKTTAGAAAGGGADGEGAGDGSDDDELKLKRLGSSSTKGGGDTASESDADSDSSDGKDEMRVKKLKSAKAPGEGDESSGDDSTSDEEKEPKKKPGGFLRRLFGGGSKDEAKKTEEDAESEGSGGSKSGKGGGKSDAKASDTDSENEENSEKPKKKKKGFFGFGGDDSEEGSSKSSEKEDSKKENKAAATPDAEKSESEGEKSVQSDDPGEKAESLANDIEAGTFHKKMEKAKEELDQIRNRMKDERVKAWADGMMSEIMKEKARLGEMAKSLNQAFRAKEAEFSRKSQFLKQEVLNREDQIRKGQIAVGRVREQLALANSGSERLKVQISTLEQQESAARQKMQAAERLTQVAKEESMALQRQVENLKAQALQAGSQGKKLELVQKELISSKALVEKANKAAEDLKKQNLALAEKLNAASQATTGAGGTEDLKRKLEAAGRVAAVHKKEAETFKGKLETTMKEEARLRAEVTKLQTEMKRMKALAGMQAAPGAASAAAAPGAPKKPGTPGGKAA